jgi:formate dehydrogenase major subunit
MHVVIDGTTYDFPAGWSVLDGVRAARIHLPAMCHDDRLVPSGECRLCLVSVKGWNKPVPACATALCEGMEIETNTPELRTGRRSLLELLVSRYPTDAVARFPEKPFHQAIQKWGLTGAPVRIPTPNGKDDSHPHISVDMARCIDCYRCIRICAELQGQFVWHARNRGSDTRIQPDGPTLRESSCVACGACVDTCPTGAIEDRSVSALAPPSEWTRTTCPYCGVGCELNIGTHRGHIVSIKPVLDAPVSKGHLCVKGRYGFDFVSAADRVTQPMIRDGAHWRHVSWNEARALVADRIHGLIERHGPDSIAMLGSARATNEDNYVAQKFARLVIGTNNVDCCARVCHTPSSTALKRSLGTGLSTNSFDDIEIARAILLCGANPTENHPVVGARIKQTVLRGTRLVVIDPRHIELADYADCHLAIHPGTNIAALNAMAHAILVGNLCDRGFIESRVSNFDEFSHFVESWPPERAARVCGVPGDAIRRAAHLYASNAPAMCINGLGLTEHVQGTDGVTALINLALLTGNIGRAGAGINPLRGQNNVQGAAHMGCEPGLLAGSTPLDQGRDAFERQWGAPLPAARGLHALHMIDAAIDGRLKALWSIGYDVLLTHPNSSDTRRALRALDLVIVQDLFLTETAREFGSVFLPACSSFEKDGTFMNAERRVQRVRAALRPVGESKPDWQILCEAARTMGVAGFAFASPEEIWNEVRTLCDGARGMAYARLDERGLQWPCPAEDHPGTPILHRNTFALGPRTALRPVEYVPTPETVSDAYPFQLMTGRSLYQFNAGTMTRRTKNNELRPADLLDVSPDDAKRLDVHDGDVVRVLSRYGSAVLPIRLNTAIQHGHLFATFQTPEVFLNALTGPHRDETTGTPEYKMTAVRIETVRF